MVTMKTERQTGQRGPWEEDRDMEEWGGGRDKYAKQQWDRPSVRCGDEIRETRSGKGTETAIEVVMQAGIGGMRDKGTLIEINTRTVV